MSATSHTQPMLLLLWSMLVVVLFAAHNVNMATTTAAETTTTATPRQAKFEIAHLWNNVSIPASDIVQLTLTYDHHLKIEVQAPFYDEPKLPDWSRHPGTFPKLYEYEVVEVFLLNDHDEYLEIEMGPKGQFLVLSLKGYRNVVKAPIQLKSYHSNVTGFGRSWMGEAIVQHSILPKKITRFNAYSIYGSNETRIYQALFPAPTNHPNYTQPDFHKLELFKPISIFHHH